MLGSTKFLESMGDEMPEGIWSNAVEVFYHPGTPEHRQYLAEIEAEIGEMPDGFHATGYVAMQFLDEGGAAPPVSSRVRAPCRTRSRG